MKNWKTCTLNVNGLTEQAVYNEETVQEVFLPLLRKLTAMWKKKGERLIVFMAAPPAAGKSTLSLFLEDLSKTVTICIPSSPSDWMGIIIIPIILHLIL